MNDQPPPRLLPLIAFTALYMLAAVAGAMVQGNKEFVFYIVVMLVLIGVMTLIHRAVTLTAALLWALSVWGLLHMAGGLVPLPQGWPFNGEHAVLYSWWIIPQRLKDDQIVCHDCGLNDTVRKSVGLSRRLNPGQNDHHRSGRAEAGGDAAGREIVADDELAESE